MAVRVRDNKFLLKITLIMTSEKNPEDFQLSKKLIINLITIYFRNCSLQIIQRKFILNIRLISHLAQF